MRIHHVAIKVSDPEECLGLYRDLLGLPELRRWFEDDGSLRSVWLRFGSDAFLALERARQSSQRSDDQTGHHCLALEIEATDREAWRARLEGAGIEIERESPYSLFFRDGDRNLLALSHYPDRDSLFGGG